MPRSDQTPGALLIELRARSLLLVFAAIFAGTMLLFCLLEKLASMKEAGLLAFLTLVRLVAALIYFTWLIDKRFLTFMTAAALALVLTFETTAGVQAQAAPVTLVATPMEVQLMPGETTHLRVVAKLLVTNTETITLTAFSDLAIQPILAPQWQQGETLYGDLVWSVAITRPVTGVNLGNIYFLAVYRLRHNDGRQEVRTAEATVTVKARPPDAIEQRLEARLETAVETLLDRQVGHAYLVVQNKAEMPITITAISLFASPEISYTTAAWGNGFTLAAQQARTLPITLTAADALLPGKQTVLIQVDASWESNGQPQQGTVVLKKEVTLGVFGESELLGIFSIPSLLFVPGFVLMGMLILLSGKVYPKALPLGLALDVKQPEFWFLSITASLITVLIYPWLTWSTSTLLSFILRQPIGARDFTRIYGFHDILILWLLALIASVVLWAVISACIWGWRYWVALCEEQQRKAEEQQRRAEEQLRADLTPAATDTAVTALRKIADNKSPLTLPQKSLVQEGKTVPVFVLPTAFPESGKVWVAPPIVVRLLEKSEARQKQLDDLLREPNQTATILSRLTEWLDPAKPIVAVEWDRRNPLIGGPQLTPEVDLHERNDADDFIKQRW
jgi:hypothetical protein